LFTLFLHNKIIVFLVSRIKQITNHNSNNILTFIFLSLNKIIFLKKETSKKQNTKNSILPQSLKFLSQIIKYVATIYYLFIWVKSMNFAIAIVAIWLRTSDKKGMLEIQSFGIPCSKRLFNANDGRSI
ncbi:hypothetical protein ACJX0J_009276, partial [Zea mays]